MDSEASSNVTTPKLPPELCDLVIDALGEDIDKKTFSMPESTARALKNCTLVCHSWRRRAHGYLKHLRIWLDDVDSLRHLGRKSTKDQGLLVSHIHYLHVRFPDDGLYPPSNVFTFLPILFKLGLSSIRRVDIIHEDSKYHQSHDDSKDIALPYLPLHPSFPSIFAPVFSTVLVLHIAGVKFKNFSDFGKLVNCFTRVEEFSCCDVRWETVGVVPGCMSHLKGYNFLRKLDRFEVRRYNTGLNCFIDTQFHRLSSG